MTRVIEVTTSARHIPRPMIRWQAGIEIVMAFGFEKPGAHVTAEEFNLFVNEAIVPRFPGITIVQAEGRWPRGMEVVSEESRLVTIIGQDGPDLTAELRIIAEAYKARFSQESVLVMRKPVEFSFV